MFFVEFDTLDLEIFVICWIESVDPVDYLCLPNHVYSVLLNTFEFKEITEVQNAHVKMLPENDKICFKKVFASGIFLTIS